MTEIEPRRMLVFRPQDDMPGKKDVTHAFKPEAEKFVAAVCTEDSPIVVVPNRCSFVGRRACVMSGFADHYENRVRAYDGVAFFCHGWKTGIQLGFRRSNVDDLAAMIDELCQRANPVVALFCCSTGGDVESSKTSPGTGDGSFADLLRDALCRRIALIGTPPHPRVFAHETVAHTTKNPRVRVFDGMGSSEGGFGGYRPVKLNGKLWPKWKRKLRGDADFRFRVPFMTVEEIEDELN